MTQPDRVPVRIGLISDTHGTLDPRVYGALAGVDAVLHAGDIGDEGILIDLEAIAPVHAVRGNMDRSWPTRPLRWREDVVIGDVRITVLHDRLSFDPARGPSPHVVVSGHTHVPEVMWIGPTLFVNPGSASRPRTADGRPTVALLELEPELRVTIVPLGDGSSTGR